LYRIGVIAGILFHNNCPSRFKIKVWRMKLYLLLASSNSSEELVAMT